MLFDVPGARSSLGLPETDCRPAMARRIVNVRRWAHALFTEPVPVSMLAALSMPVLVITGSDSTASAHGVAGRLVHVLGHVEHVELPGLGHMGPITHPDVVNAEIERFLLATDPTRCLERRTQSRPALAW
jgi:pimeloyl-ACP methyl ester carboxylesterase